MNAGPFSFHVPEAEDIEISWEAVGVLGDDHAAYIPAGSPRDYKITFRAYPDECDVSIYQHADGAVTHPRTVKTVADLTLGDIDRTSISIDWNGDTIAGVIRDIRTDTDTLFNGLKFGDRSYRRGERCTRVRISFKNFVVSDLPLDHPCEVIA